MEERISRVLQELSHEGTVCGVQMPVAGDNYVHQANLCFLRSVLDRLDINLSHHTDRTLEEELTFWDQDHLVDLAEHFDIYQQGTDKLRYLVTHNIQGDLVEALTNPVDKSLVSKLTMANEHTHAEVILQTKQANQPQRSDFSAYNAHVLAALWDHGVNTEVWLSPGNNLKVKETKNPNQSLTFLTWERDFRSEFAMGNISECCISVARDENLQYKTVLLDYFLDTSINVVKIHVDEHHVGQAYLSALSHPEVHEQLDEDELASRSVMGVSFVAMKNELRYQHHLVPAMVDALVGPESYLKDFGFDSAMIAGGFYMLSDYIMHTKKAFQKFPSKIKQKRHDCKSQLKQNKGNETKTKTITTKKLIINGELKKIEEYQKKFKKPDVIQVYKMGFPSAYEELWNGTEYLDSFGKGEHDGFFHPDGQKKKADGIFCTENPISGMTDFLSHLEKTYPPKR